MSTTLQDFVIPKGTWTDLYALTGITVGNQIEIYNKSSSCVVISNSTVQPTLVTTGIPLHEDSSLTITSSNLRVWAYSGEDTATLSVQESTLNRQRQGALLTSSVGLMGMPFTHAVALGLIPGAARVVGLGRNQSVSTATAPEDVYEAGGLYPWPAAAAVVKVVSTSANDSAAGTGARTVLISGLDANYVEQTETVTLNGLTPVLSTKLFLRVNSFLIMSAGTLKVNDGTIDAINNTNGVDVLSRIPVGIGISRSAIYTVPAGKTLLIESIFISINGNNSGVTAVISTYFGSVNGFYRLPVSLSVQSNPYEHFTDPPIIATEKTDFALRALTVSSNNVDITSAFSGVLYTNALTTAL